ncbi:Phage tail sheath protein FI [Olavius algarvensis associated proteobacterium Delta 3]|nr:Phage tail sheath protein FI [Olavius algarvensis associated proteobacterium Delta 3]CAB5171866.1 Phage tail sheath protein FI [Olavius algarvensis associated proteobacterium Delta 3]
MPEYLAPGVYVEETSFRAKSIEGVATSTAGFVGQCRYGPVKGAPVLVTSFDEFQRHFGGIEQLSLQGALVNNYLAHAVKLFFDNGGQRVYVGRVFRPMNPTGNYDQDVDANRARGNDMLGGSARFKARYPGALGNAINIEVNGFRSGNLLIGQVGNRQLRGLRPGDMVEFDGTGAKPREIAQGGPAALTPANIRIAQLNNANEFELVDRNGQVLNIDAAVASVQKILLTVAVQCQGREDIYQGLSTFPNSEVSIASVLRHEDPDNGIEPPTDRTALVFLELDSVPVSDQQKRDFAVDFLSSALASNNRKQTFSSGSDGQVCSPAEFDGDGDGHDARGLNALAEEEDIAIVAAPGAAGLTDPNHRQAVRNSIISHCENLKYRFAILSANQNADQSQIGSIRAEHDSKYAALYYPWLVVTNPLNAVGQGRDTVILPPDGAIAGIYARSDIERGVHKAPANEVVRGVLRFSRNVNKGMQDVLNPEGINCLRFFEGRGYRVWGARTISSDPEWTYLNVRRLFIFLEHSIDRGTQWAVFEPNNIELWLRIRLTISSFLTEVWRTGALMGATSEEAFFVRCDRSTMSQSDLDNGRLVCLIGVAPTKPAEYVIFRIGQWTADASII